MLSRLILAAIAVAALTAFVRQDVPDAAPVFTRVPTATPLPTRTPLPTVASSAATDPASAARRPVRVVLAPLFSTPATEAAASGTSAGFIPTPGSPIGPRAASLTTGAKQPKERLAAAAGSKASGMGEPPAPRSARHAMELPGVALR